MTPDPVPQPDIDRLGSTDRNHEEPQARLYFPALDGLRFLAFLLVFFRHMPRLPGVYGDFLKNMGWVGVELFFVLTGFLFFAMLRKEHAETGTVSYRKFYLRRVLRIMPLYFLYLAIIATLAVVHGDQAIAAKFLAYATFTINLVCAFLGNQWLIAMGPHLWTIGYEEQVYLLLPLAIVAILRTKRQSLSVAMLLATAIAGTVLHYLALKFRVTHGNGTYLVPLFRPETMIAGIVCGIAWTTGAYRRLPSWSYGLLALAVVCVIFVVCTRYNYRLFHFHASWFTYPVLAVLFGSTLLYVLSPGSWLGRLLAVRPFPWLGKISYGLYVWHLLATQLSGQWIVRPLHLPRGYGVPILAAFIATVAIAAASYYFFERPFIRLKERFQVVHNRPS